MNKPSLSGMGIAAPQIMLPAAPLSLEHWAVLACDQFTSDKDYWRETRRIVGTHPSTLNMIIPECYLKPSTPNSAEALSNSPQRIHGVMRHYCSPQILRTLPPGFVLTERSTSYSPCRRGLVLAVDLEAYDFADKSTSPIRPSEDTIRDRLPPRIMIRREAALDVSHILLLYNDPGGTVINSAELLAGETLYDFNLMQGSGHLRGRFIANPAPLADAFAALAANQDILFAVGDGNHSLAAARETWLEKKAAGAPENSPSRYALAEAINIHDEGLRFHPIHRLLFHANPEEVIAFLRGSLSGMPPAENCAAITIITAETEQTLTVPLPPGQIAAEPLQAALDEYLSRHSRVSIDFIHGEDALAKLARQKDRIGFLLPELDKNTFFNRLSAIGPYPRKSFSIGEATEKRCYLETRRLD
ncbi:MAG: hypothetical protein B0D92_05580 [Spirochaeta sp. LUC14_002_19_P3]|nr:MAG: hypothetical protein B0D92_05580 [Spirochaeta sp. LUC14_002_19_P3]